MSQLVKFVQFLPNMPDLEEQWAGIDPDDVSIVEASKSGLGTDFTLITMKSTGAVVSVKMAAEDAINQINIARGKE